MCIYIYTINLWYEALVHCINKYRETLRVLADCHLHSHGLWACENQLKNGNFDSSILIKPIMHINTKNNKKQ